MDRSFRLGEAGSLSVRVADRIVGVRTNDADLADELRELLVDHLEHAAAAPPYLSLRIGEDDGMARDKHVLYVEGRPEVRTTDRARLVRAAVSHLAGHLPATPGHLRLHGTVLVAEGEALVAIPPAASRLARELPRLRRLGWEEHDAPFAEIERETAQLVITDLLTGRDERRTYPLGALVLPDVPEEARIRSQAVAGIGRYLAGRVGEDPQDRSHDVAALAELLDIVPVRYVGDVLGDLLGASTISRSEAETPA